MTNRFGTREAGLEPLAEALLASPDQSPQQVARRYFEPNKGVMDAAAALEGARAILVERFSEDAMLIGTLREEVWSRGRLCSRVRAGKAEAGAKFADYFEFSEPSGSDARSPGRSTSKENRRPRRRRPGCRFAADSPLEGTGFEPSVPLL